MKKLAFTLTLCLITGASFAQKKALSEAKNELNATTSNFVEARNFINSAKTNPETLENPETWYVAGKIENKQFDTEHSKTIFGQVPDENVMYKALDAIYPLFEKAYTLDNLPNDKGKIKPKYTKDIKAIMKANRLEYVNAGFHFLKGETWEKAYANLMLYLNMPELPMMAGEKWPPVNPNDSLEIQVKFYAALSAFAIPDYPESVRLFNLIKDTGYEGNEVYQRLCYAYDKMDDSLAVVNVLKEGVIKFPREEYYLLNLIDKSIKSGNIEDAISYLKIAIEQNPDAVFYDALGVVYENAEQYDLAIENYSKSIEIKSDIVVYKHLGNLYNNLGIKSRGKADELSDKKLADEELKKSEKYFKESLKYFEIAYEINPKDFDVVSYLRFIYYSLKMGDEFEKMDEIYTNFSKE